MTSRSAPPPDPRWRRCDSVASIAAVIVTLFTASAQAEDAVELEWSAPPGCPDASVVLSRIRSLAGGTLRTKERLRATGRIERRGERFRLTLSVRDESSVGERTVDSDSCADLAGAAAVALGLLLENKRQEEAAQTRPDGASGAPGQNSGSGGAAAATNPPKSAPPPPTPPDDPGDSSANDGSERAFRVLAQLPLATLDLGPLPKTSYGLGVGLGVKVDTFRVVAIGRYFTTVSLVASDYPAVGVDIDRLSSELWSGYGWRAGSFELTPCITAALDHYTARGVGRFVAPRSARTLALALGGGVMADVHLVEWLSITGSAALRAETSRPRFVVGDFGDVRRGGPTQASFALGLSGTL